MKKILLIDSDKNTRVLLVRILRELADIDMVLYPSQANLNDIEQYSIIITDIDFVGDPSIPKMDGPEFIKTVRQKSPKVKIFVITCLALECFKEESFNAGADKFISKPFDLKEFSETIKEAL